MKIHLLSSCQRFFFYSVFITCQLYFVRSQNHIRLFSFTNTDAKSPTDIDDSCLTIESTLVILYQGLTLDLLKASSDGSCQLWDFELNGIRKNIVRDKHERRLCRTEFTVSINNTRCGNTVQYICQENDINSIYIQECIELDYYKEKETANNNIEALIMSELPEPTASNFGPVYEIPKAHCSRKQIISDSQSKLYTIDGISIRENQGYSDKSYSVRTLFGKLSGWADRLDPDFIADMCSYS
ncbi:uncharacterized protein LOC111108851 [Crassostrea virginica]